MTFRYSLRAKKRAVENGAIDQGHGHRNRLCAHRSDSFARRFSGHVSVVPHRSLNHFSEGFWRHGTINVCCREFSSQQTGTWMPCYCWAAQPGPQSPTVAAVEARSTTETTIMPQGSCLSRRRLPAWSACPFLPDSRASTDLAPLVSEKGPKFTRLHRFNLEFLGLTARRP